MEYGERKIDEAGFLWEWSVWHGDWVPVLDWFGEQVRVNR